ncbi:hypothetical protein [Pedobacter sp. AJM]|uniref:hypothetical protein n=1 Tax=Pedobacter sp. AJM TaxID=2003629 RepID=UPI001556CDD0|nr:hypothetical protein [Pedobacter sp. AJM]
MLRLGFRQISGIKQDDVEALVLGRGSGDHNLHSLLHARVSLGALERPAGADVLGRWD